MYRYLGRLARSVTRASISMRDVGHTFENSVIWRLYRATATACQLLKHDRDLETSAIHIITQERQSCDESIAAPILRNDGAISSERNTYIARFHLIYSTLRVEVTVTDSIASTIHLPNRFRLFPTSLWHDFDFSSSSLPLYP
jgi:hypothetical protein